MAGVRYRTLGLLRAARHLLEKLVPTVQLGSRVARFDQPGAMPRGEHGCLLEYAPYRLAILSIGIEHIKEKSIPERDRRIAHGLVGILHDWLCQLRIRCHRLFRRAP